MRRVLVILCLLAVPIQFGAFRLVPEPSLAGPRSDPALAAIPLPTSANVIARRISPLEPLLGQEVGCLSCWTCDLASAHGCVVPMKLGAGLLASNDSLQSQSVRWQI